MLGLLKLNLTLRRLKMIQWIKAKLETFIKNKSQNFKLLNQWLGLL